MSSVNQMNAKAIAQMITNPSSHKQLMQVCALINSGNQQLYTEFKKALTLLQSNQQYTQAVYDSVMQLSVSAVPSLINDLNNDVYPKIAVQHARLAEKQKTTKQLDQYISLLKHMYGGQEGKEDYPNLVKTFSACRLSKDGGNKYNNKMRHYLDRFTENFSRIQNKKVQFFEDFEDSSLSSSFQEQSRMSEIVYMDIMEIKALRQKVQSPQTKITEEMCSEYLLKLRTFLNLKTANLSSELQIEFNKQKLWAKHFIEKYPEYLKNDKNNSRGISLNKDEESFHRVNEGDINHKNFQKKGKVQNANFPSENDRNSTTHDNTANFARYSQQPSRMSNNNYTINELPLDESKFTENSSKKLPTPVVPVYSATGGGADGNTRYQQLQSDRNSKRASGVNQVSEIPANRYGNDRPDAYSLGYSKNPAQKMSFTPSESRQSSTKPIPKPNIQETFSIDDGSFSINQSVPQESVRNHIPQSSSLKKSVQFPQGLMPRQTNNFSASNNPFASQATHFFKDDSSKQASNLKQSPTQYDRGSNQKPKAPAQYHQVQETPYLQKADNAFHNSSARNRMRQNDLDSQGIEPDLVVTPYRLSNINSRSHNTEASHHYLSKVPLSQYSQTVQNFKPEKVKDQNRLTLEDLGYKTQKPSRHNTEQMLSPGKKRLSQVTSEKKLRKTHAPKKYQINNLPQEYVTRPYSIHFERFQDSLDFNNYKRNCFEDFFTLYSSDDLKIICSFQKVGDSKLKINLNYQSQNREMMKVNVLYKIPKCFKIQKVSKIHRKFLVYDRIQHCFVLDILEFPLQMCLLDLSYRGQKQKNYRVGNLHIPMPVTIKNFIELILTSKQEWLENWERLVNEERLDNLHPNSSKNGVFHISKTFELNRSVIEPSEFGVILNKQFVSIGSIQGYSVEQFGCMCHYRNMNNLLFLLRVSIRVDHIVTVQILTEQDSTNSEKDFMRYYLDILTMLLARYQL